MPIFLFCEIQRCIVHCNSIHVSEEHVAYQRISQERNQHEEESKQNCVGVSMPGRNKRPFLHSVQTSSGAHPVVWAPFRGSKAAGARSQPLTSIWCRDGEWDLSLLYFLRLHIMVLNQLSTGTLPFTLHYNPGDRTGHNTLVSCVITYNYLVRYEFHVMLGYVIGLV
jgi:hypothetical protein